MLAIEGERYEYEMNVLLHCGEYGIPIVEVPIKTVNLDKENSCSHFDGVKDSFRIYKNIAKFASSSLICFAVDYLLFLLLSALLPAGAAFTLVCNIGARMISAVLNYIVNARAVFRDKQPVRQTLPRYAALAAIVLTANSLLLTLLAGPLGIPAFAAKLVTELILFILSFTVQSKFIFKDQNAGKGGENHAVRRTAHKNAA